MDKHTCWHKWHLIEESQLLYPLALKLTKAQYLLLTPVNTFLVRRDSWAGAFSANRPHTKENQYLHNSQATCQLFWNGFVASASGAPLMVFFLKWVNLKMKPKASSSIRHHTKNSKSNTAERKFNPNAKCSRSHRTHLAFFRNASKTSKTTFLVTKFDFN